MIVDSSSDHMILLKHDDKIKCFHFLFI